MIIVLIKQEVNLTENLIRHCEVKMKFTDKEHNYIESEEEREIGHEDTRYKNFECENKSRLGCNLGIDVAG